jgi:hypothetical protein
MKKKIAILVEKRIIGLMKIEKMTKSQLLKEIEKADRKLNNPLWIKNTSNFMVGVIIIHRNRLKEQLEK